MSDEDVLKAFDSLGRLNIETKHILYNKDIQSYLLNRFKDTDNVEEAARRIKFNIYEIPKCPICGNNCKYIGGKKVYDTTCSNKICKNKYKYNKHLETFKFNHNGLTNIFQLPEVKEKIKESLKDKRHIITEKSKQTKLERYGDENYNNIEKSKKTCLEKYGVEYSFQSENNKQKSKKTCLEKYGVEYATQSKIIQNKQKQTKLERYGDENYFNVKKYKQTKLERYGDENYINIEKSKQTRLERYGDENYHNKEKIKQTNLAKYGYTTPLSQPQIKDKLKSDITKLKKKQTCLERYGVEHISQVTYIKDLIFNSQKKNGTINKSKEEDKSYELLRQIFPDCIRNYKDNIRYPFACDFYIPSLDLFIECQYSFFHNKRPYLGNEADLKEIEIIKEKSLKRKQETNKKKSRYDALLDTWTVRDVLKRNTAKQNNLNYLEFFTILELENWLKTYEAESKHYGENNI